MNVGRWVSGRGVGLDVVRTAVEQMGGTLTVQSSPGEGCRVQIRVPLEAADLMGRRED